MGCSEAFRSFIFFIFDSELLAETLSSCILILIGDGSVAQWVLLNKENPGKYEPFLLVNMGYGCGVAFGAYLAAGISGAHMNPAVTLAMACFGKFKWRKVPKYILGQFIGSFIGAALVFISYYERLRTADNGVLGDLNQDMKGIYATYPNPRTSTLGQFLDQVLGTMILLLIVNALGDNENSAPPKGVTPFVVGLTVFAIGASFGTNCGYAINPTRDLAPRILSALVGYKNTFSAGSYYFWIPILGPILGGILGTGIYKYMLQSSRHFKVTEYDRLKTARRLASES